MEPFSALLALCVGNSPVTCEFPSQRPVTQGFDVFFHLGLNKQLSKQSWGRWFETPTRSLWRNCNENNGPSILHNQCHGCWWSDDAGRMSSVIRSYAIGRIDPEYSDFSSRGNKTAYTEADLTVAILIHVISMIHRKKHGDVFLLEGYLWVLLGGR